MAVAAGSNVMSLVSDRGTFSNAKFSHALVVQNLHLKSSWLGNAIYENVI